MQQSRFKLQIIIFLFGYFSGLFAQDYSYNLEVLNVEDGLPSRRVAHILKDDDGYMWLSTLGVIYKYDGQYFDPVDRHLLPLSLTSIPYITIDGDNNLWYLNSDGANPITKAGVVCADRKAVVDFATFSGGIFTSADVVRIIQSQVVKSDIFIITRDKKVYKYNKSFEEIYQFDLSFYYEPTISIEHAPNGGYLIGLSKTFFRVKNKVKVAEYFPAKEDPRFKVYKDEISSLPKPVIHVQGNRVLLNRYYDKDITCEELVNGQLVPFRVGDKELYDAVSMVSLGKDYICYIKKGALCMLNFEGDTLLYKSGFPMPFHDFSTPYIDEQNLIWIPSVNGLYKINASKNVFEVLQAGSSIRGIYRKDNQLYIGNYTENVIVDLLTGAKEMFPCDIGPVTYFEEDANHNLWMTAEGRSILKYDVEWNTFYPYPLDGHKKATAYIPFYNTLTQDYWVGTSAGLYRLDKHKDTLMLFGLEQAVIRDFHVNEAGVWIATSQGIFHLDPEMSIIRKHYTIKDGIPHDNINHIYEDGAGVFWLGTAGGGLIRWNLSNNKFTQFTRKHGLSNNTIYAVYEDDYNNLWLPSNYGLMCFDKTSHQVRVYFSQHGIAHNEFNTYAHFQDKDGTLYFGGISGVTKFHPKDFIAKENNNIPIKLTSIQVLAEDANEFHNITDDFYHDNRVEVNPRDQILEIDISLLDYYSPKNNQYAYRIRGLDDNWIHTNDPKISIRNMPYGKYNIEVKGRGYSGVWTDQILTIPLKVNRPFYLTPEFLCLMMLACVSGLYLFFKWWVYKLEQDSKRLEEEVRRRTEKINQQAEELKALDKAKTRFFTNITHEFRTPLTLIIGPLEQIYASSPAEAIRRQLSVVLYNARHLHSIINQLLDISKLEGNRMNIEWSHGDIVWYTRELIKSFAPMYEQKQLQLSFRSSMEGWKIDFDSNQWNKIVYNLLSNAMKFTHENGSIRIALNKILKKNQEHIQLVITDTGIGIPKEKLNHIFDRFYQVDASMKNTQSGTGIGLALVKELIDLQGGEITVSSEIKKGTSFTVVLPVLVADQTAIVKPLDKDFRLHSSYVFSQNDNVFTTKEKLNMTGALPDTGNNKENLVLLIIEDNLHMQFYIKSCLEPYAREYEVHFANDGEEGIRRARLLVPDLIISDVMMPVKNGFEVTRIIRSELAISHIPVILLTAKSSLESRLEGLRRGADAYLTKPFSPKELNLRVQKLIEIREMLRKRYQQEEWEPNDELSPEDDFIVALRNFIVENIQADLNSEYVSQHFAMSRVQLYRKLKALTGHSLTEFIRGVRLEKACKLIEDKKLNMTEIAYETGFSSPSHFSRVFKKVYGKPPSKKR